MKRNLLFLSTALILFLLFSPSVALACSMKLTPSTPAASVGETITFRLERALTHRNCVLPIEQTQIKVTGGEVVDAGVWKKGNPDVLEFKVRFTQPGDSLIRIERDCSMVLHDLAPFLSIHRPAIITAKSAPIAQAKFQINNRMASSRGTGLLKT